MTVVRAVSGASFTQESCPEPLSVIDSLLPEPDAALAGDPLSLIYLYESKDQNLSVEQGSTRIQDLQSERNRSLATERQSIANEDAAVKHRGFWSDLGNVLGDVAKVAGIVASVAVTVCTFGSAAPVAAVAIAGILLSSASFVDGEFHVLQKLGVDGKAAGWVDAGMAVAGTLCSLGASSITAGAVTASQVGSVVSRTAAVVSGVTSMAQGVSTVAAGKSQDGCDDANAEEAAAVVQSADALRFIQVVISETEISDDSSKQIMSTIVSMKGIEESTAIIAATAAMRG